MTAVEPAGFATRAVGLAIDGAVLVVVTIVVGAGTWLAATVVGMDVTRNAVAFVLGGLGWLLLAGVYLAAFFSLTGQTPGMRAMGLRVVDLHGRRPGRGRSAVRAVGMFLAALPAGAGFLLILVDDRRRALQDRLAGTLVIYDDSGSGAVIHTEVLHPLPD